MIELHFAKKKPIAKGWSADQKFFVENSDGVKYLLRISSIEQYDAKKAEFELMRRVAELDVPMCRPIEFGVCADGVFSLQSWIDGIDAKDYLAGQPPLRQYTDGSEAGRILKKIHSIPAPSGLGNWASRFNRKIDGKISGYHNCSVKFDGAELMIDYINAHRYLLEGRPQCYQHGDYHIGNMMCDRTGTLVIIDFNRHDFGDPWEDFNRIVWCAQSMPPFASGMIDGYFGGAPPLHFWELLALYIACNTLSSIPWAIPFGGKEVTVMQNLAAEILNWYDNMQNTLPLWYANRPQL